MFYALVCTQCIWYVEYNKSQVLLTDIKVLASSPKHINVIISPLGDDLGWDWHYVTFSDKVVYGSIEST